MRHVLKKKKISVAATLRHERCISKSFIMSNPLSLCRFYTCPSFRAEFILYPHIHPENSHLNHKAHLSQREFWEFLKHEQTQDMCFRLFMSSHNHHVTCLSPDILWFVISSRSISALKALLHINWLFVWLLLHYFNCCMFFSIFTHLLLYIFYILCYYFVPSVTATVCGFFTL